MQSYCHQTSYSNLGVNTFPINNNNIDQLGQLNNSSNAIEVKRHEWETTSTKKKFKCQTKKVTSSYANVALYQVCILHASHALLHMNFGCTQTHTHTP